MIEAKWQLTVNGRRVGKAHSTRIACVIEAFERRLVITWRYGRNVALIGGAAIERE